MANGERKLPDGWKWVRLGEACPEKAATRNPASLPDAPFVYIDISSIDSQTKCVVAPKRLLGNEAPSRARQLVRAGDVIVSNTRPNLNAVAVIDQGLDGQICSTGFTVLRPGPEISSDYLFAFLRSPEFVQSVSELVKGALYPAVTEGQVREQSLPLPPLPEQRRIAAILAAGMAEIEKARAAAQAQLEAAKNLPAAFLRDVFPKPGEELPEGWRWVRLRDICVGKGQYGLSGKASPEPNGIPMLRMGNIHAGKIFWDDLKYISISEEIAKQYILKRNDLLFNRTNSAELVGKSAVFDGTREAMFASYLIRFVIKSDLADSQFLCLYINSKNGRIFIEQNMARAIGQANISASTMQNMPIPLPPIEEQKMFGILMNERIDAVNKFCDAFGTQLSDINALPSSLLRQAFNGEL